MREESKRLRVLWLCNICPPSAAAALGRSYSVRGRVADRGAEPLSGG